jgi:hypothetical protein
VYGVTSAPGARDGAYCVNFDGGAYQGDLRAIRPLLKSID